MEQIRLQPPHMKRMIEVISTAFVDYPLNVEFYPERDSRLQQVSRGMGMLVRYGMRYGESYGISPDIRGIALWLPWKHVYMSLRGWLCSGSLFSLFSMDWSTLLRVQRYGRFIEDIHHRLAPFPHWYLQLLAVEPSAQGQGLASALLRPMLRRIDREGMPCYLETQEERNVALYEHFGFRVLDVQAMPGIQVHNWMMLRQPARGTV